MTTPLFYANAAPHMGSAYPTIAADALCRFYRLAGAQAVMVTGCDEHGEKIAAAAEKNGHGSNPQGFVDAMAKDFKRLWTLLDIAYDRFVRTTDTSHQRVVRYMLDRVWERGDIYKDVYDGLYCTDCEEYKVESDLQDGNVCPIHLKACERRTEDNYFFALSKYQTQLQALLEENNTSTTKDIGGGISMQVRPVERLNEVLGWVRSGVRDFSVSRANNPWGIRVPRDDTHTVYVWFDALFGYVSGLIPPSTLSASPDSNDVNKDKILSEAQKHGWPAHVHIIGKDILRFHAVYWPAMLMSAGLSLPSKVVGHGFITKNGMKMGKSLGNTLDPFELVEEYGSDAVRYYFLRGVEFGRDGDFSNQRFVDIVNADLANSLGNLLNRSINLARKNCKDGLPSLPSSKELLQADKENDVADAASVAHAADCARDVAYAMYDDLDFVKACEAVMGISYEANAYIDRVAPWTKFKSEVQADRDEAARCLTITLEACRLAAVGLSPVTPRLSEKVFVALGMQQQWGDGLQWERDMEWGGLPEGLTFGKPKPVFPRMEMPSDAKTNLVESQTVLSQKS